MLPSWVWGRVGGGAGPGVRPGWGWGRAARPAVPLSVFFVAPGPVLKNLRLPRYSDTLHSVRAAPSRSTFRPAYIPGPVLENLIGPRLRIAFEPFAPMPSGLAQVGLQSCGLPLRSNGRAGRPAPTSSPPAGRSPRRCRCRGAGGPCSDRPNSPARIVWNCLRALLPRRASRRSRRSGSTV